MSNSNNSLVPATIAPVAMSTIDDVMKIGKVMAESGFFQDSRQAAQAVVKILAGQELGFGPFASMTGVFIISGRPAIGANLMAAAVKRSGRFDYRVVRLDDDGCEIAFFERGQEIGRSAFTKEDAKRAGTKNTDKFPRNMYFARAMSNGVRWYCPSIFAGAPVYTPEELGATVNPETGEIIEGEYTHTPTPQPAAKIVAAANDDLFSPQAPERPATAHTDGVQGKPAAGSVDWRKKLEGNSRPTVGTVASLIVNASSHYQSQQHALNAINKIADEKHNMSDKLEKQAALEMFDALMAHAENKQDYEQQTSRLVSELTGEVLDPFFDQEN